MNWAFLTPSMLTQMCKANIFTQYDFASLDVVMTGGFKPSKEILKQAREALSRALVTNAYGKQIFPSLNNSFKEFKSTKSAKFLIFCRFTHM